MDEDEDMMSPPFWLQPTNNHRLHRRHLRRTYSLMVTSATFLILITVTTFILIFIILPTLKSFTSQIFRPQLVKKSWDSLNLILVLFAIICGFLSKNNNNNNNSNNDTPRAYYYHEDRRLSSDQSGISRLRSFKSYPDLKQESLWGLDDERWRFHDDITVGGYRRPSEVGDRRRIQHRRVRSEVIEEDHELDGVRNIHVDTSVPPETMMPQVGPVEGGRRIAKAMYCDDVGSKNEEFGVAGKFQPPPYVAAPAAEDTRRNENRMYRADVGSKNEELGVAGKFQPPPYMADTAAEMRTVRVGHTDGIRWNENRMYRVDVGSKTEEFDVENYRRPPSMAAPVAEKVPVTPPQLVATTESIRRNTKRAYHEDAGLENVELDVAREYQPPPYTAAETEAPARGVWKNSRRTHRSSRPVSVIEKEEKSEIEVRNLNLRPPQAAVEIPAPPPPPPLPSFYLSSEKKKKRGSATKEFLTSLRGKKKKQRQKSIENFETFLNSQSSHPPPPPPPPLPPPFFQNLFSPKKPKHKKVHSFPVLPSQVTKTQKPSIPKETEIFNLMEKTNVVTTGNESPFNGIPPPPPPPPPFGIPAWRFRVQGDFVRINSGRSSRSNSPDIDEESVDSPMSEEQEKQQQTRTVPLFCPSPDVDTKADTFIARFRAGLKMEKMNSMKGKSNLGPS